VDDRDFVAKGDFFGLDADATGGQVDSIWDRASMVAIDPVLRGAYVNVMKKLLKPGGTILW
jgi:Thiopurine S-methyltransferase (TPMT)